MAKDYDYPSYDAGGRVKKIKEGEEAPENVSRTWSVVQDPYHKPKKKMQKNWAPPLPSKRKKRPKRMSRYDRAVLELELKELKNK